jgi:hypothetical protein
MVTREKCWTKTSLRAEDAITEEAAEEDHYKPQSG